MVRILPGVLSLAVLGALAAATLGAQDLEPAPSAGSPTFRLESDLVVLQVSVFDGRGSAVPGLDRSMFQIVEDGAPQDITFFGGDDVPVAVGLVVDNSSSMLNRRPMVRAGMKAFAETSRPDDEAFTVVFNERVVKGLPDVVAFTNNPVLLESTLARVPAGGRTALYDAVIDGLAHLDRATLQKHVLVVLSDGGDNASRHTEAEMVRAADEANALVYTVSTARLNAGFGDEGLLRRLARSTGGLAFTPRSEAEVVSAFGEIAQKIRRVYSLGYVSTNAVHDGRRRQLTVRVRPPGVSRPVVHARDGYRTPVHDHGR